MSRYVEWHGKLWPRSLFEPPLDLPPGTCTWCGGSGITFEQIDEDRLDVAVQCQRCQMWCKVCRGWVARSGHGCCET